MQRYAVRMTFHEAIAGEIRAAAARQQLRNVDVAKAIGQSPMNTSRRMRGLTPFGLDELPTLADLFGCAVEDLIPSWPQRDEPRSVVNGRTQSPLRLITLDAS